MSKQVTIDELLDLAANTLPSHRVEAHRAVLFAAVHSLAQEVADKLGVRNDTPDDFAGQVLVAFYPERSGPCPEILHAIDQGGSWVTLDT